MRSIVLFIAAFAGLSFTVESIKHTEKQSDKLQTKPAAVTTKPQPEYTKVIPSGHSEGNITIIETADERCFIVGRDQIHFNLSISCVHTNRCKEN